MKNILEIWMNFIIDQIIKKIKNKKYVLIYIYIYKLILIF